MRVVSTVGRFGLVVSAWVVSAKFWGESIRPILVGRFGRGSFRPMWGEGVGILFIRRLGTSIYCLPNKNIRNIRHFQINV